MASDLIVDTVETMVRGYRSILSRTTVPHGKMFKIKDHLSVNVGAILFATILLLLAKAFAGFKANILDSFALNLGIALISVFMLFLLPTVIFLVQKVQSTSPSGGADEETPTEVLIDKITSAAIFIWIISLIILIIDYSLNYVFDHSFITWIGWQVGSQKTSRVIAVIFYTLLASAILLIRSRYSMPLSRSDWIVALITVAVLGTLNATMMYYLIYVVQVGSF